MNALHLTLRNDSYPDAGRLLQDVIWSFNDGINKHVSTASKTGSPRRLQTVTVLSQLAPRFPCRTRLQKYPPPTPTSTSSLQTKVGCRLDTDYLLISWMVRHPLMCGQTGGRLTKCCETTAAVAGLLWRSASFRNEALAWEVRSRRALVRRRALRRQPETASWKREDVDKLVGELFISAGGAEPALDLQMGHATTTDQNLNPEGAFEEKTQDAAGQRRWYVTDALVKEPTLRDSAHESKKTCCSKAT